jgi:hypothetical protein
MHPADHAPLCVLCCACCAGYRQGVVLPAFETIDDGDEGKNTALKAIKSEQLSSGAWCQLFEVAVCWA